MSLRRLPVSLDERVAALEEFQRALQSQAASDPIDIRFIYGAKGDILVAVDVGQPAALKAGALGDVLTITGPLTLEWRDPDRIRASILSAPGQIVIGIGGTSAIGLPAPTADGQVLTSDLSAIGHARWV